ncbi:MAG: hypothetical protein WCG27_06560, partial [Pseudomonadota bacterium]
MKFKSPFVTIFVVVIFILFASPTWAMGWKQLCNPLLEKIQITIGQDDPKVSLKFIPQGPAQTWALEKANTALTWLSHFLRLNDINKIYLKLKQIQHSFPDTNIYQALLTAMSAHTQILHYERIQKIPETGPCIIAANMPFGSVEILAVANAVRQRRADVKVLAATEMIEIFPELASDIIPLTDLDSNPQRVREWLQEGHALVVFAAPERSRLDVSDQTGIGYRDPSWHPGLVQLWEQTLAPLVPVYIDGGPGILYEAARFLGLESPMFYRELADRNDQLVNLAWGNPLNFSQISKVTDKTNFVRGLIYAMADAIPNNETNPSQISHFDLAHQINSLREDARLGAVLGSDGPLIAILVTQDALNKGNLEAVRQALLRQIEK